MKFKYDYADLFMNLSLFILTSIVAEIIILLVHGEIYLNDFIYLIIGSVVISVIMNIYSNINRIFRLINYLEIIEDKTDRDIKKILKAYKQKQHFRRIRLGKDKML